MTNICFSVINTETPVLCNSHVIHWAFYYQNVHAHISQDGINYFYFHMPITYFINISKEIGHPPFPISDSDTWKDLKAYHIRWGHLEPMLTHINLRKTHSRSQLVKPTWNTKMREMGVRKQTFGMEDKGISTRTNSTLPVIHLWYTLVLKRYDEITMINDSPYTP